MLTNFIEVISNVGTRSMSDAEVSALCHRAGMSPAAFCDSVAFVMAERYLAGGIAWAAADSAMIRLHQWAYRDRGPGLSDFAWTVYSAFVLGEERHAGQPADAADDYFCLPLLQLACRSHRTGHLGA